MLNFNNFNKHSKLIQPKEKKELEEGEEAKEVDQQKWVCEFCNKNNPVDIEEEEIPKSEKINYVIEAVAQMKEKKLGKVTE